MKNIFNYITIKKIDKKQFREKVRTFLTKNGFYNSILEYRKEDGVEVLDIVTFDSEKNIWDSTLKTNSDRISLFDGKITKILNFR